MKSMELPVGFAVIFTLLLAFNVYLSVKINFQDKKIEELMNEEEHGSEDLVAKEKMDNDAGLLEKILFETSAKREKRNVGRGKRKKKKPYGCHLVGVKQPKVNSGEDYLLWADPKYNRRRSHCDLKLEKNHFDMVKSILITKNGSYLVYAQLTLNSTGIMEMGFETKLLDHYQRNNDDREVTLMRTWIQQHYNASIPNRRYLDSGYQSGYFKLLEGQKLQVRHIRLNIHLFLSEPDVAYFGVVLLK